MTRTSDGHEQKGSVVFNLLATARADDRIASEERERWFGARIVTKMEKIGGTAVARAHTPVSSRHYSHSYCTIPSNVREAYSYNAPRSLPLIRQSTPAPTSETPTTPRNLLLHLTPATILQQTSSTRPSTLPCEPSPPHFLVFGFPYIALKQKKTPLIILVCLQYTARMARPPRSLCRWRRRVGRIPVLRGQSRARVELRDAPCAQRVA